MNRSVVLYIVSLVLRIEAILMVFPLVTAIVYKEKNWVWFVAAAAVTVLFSHIISPKKPESMAMYTREGFSSVALSWFAMSFFGALPFCFSKEIPSLIDAMFETVSGFTTTGASILSNVEGLSHGMLMWRSFTHWIGGMGVLVFVLAILPMAGAENIHIMRAESPGPSVGKLVPKVRSTAKILYGIYLVLTILQLVLLLLGDMPLFDAICISLGTAGTGGFAIKNSGLADYTVYQQAITTIFMIVFGVNFNVYFLFYARKPKDALKCEEARAYLAIILASALLIAINVRNSFGSFFESFHHSIFQVASIITTTGFSTVDFDKWPVFSKGILVLLMFIGACAGSTGGGIKVSRIVILIKTVMKEMASMIHPRLVKVIKFEDKPVEHTVLRSINTFLVAYIVLFIGSFLVVSFDNFDFESTFTAVAATLNNIGPGLAKVGPTCNFGSFSVLSKLVLICDMIAGRLELFPVLLLLSTRTWRKQL